MSSDGYVRRRRRTPATVSCSVWRPEQLRFSLRMDVCLSHRLSYVFFKARIAFVHSTESLLFFIEGTIDISVVVKTEINIGLNSTTTV